MPGNFEKDFKKLMLFYINIGVEIIKNRVIIYIDMFYFLEEIERIYIYMGKKKKSITLSKDVAEMLSQIAKKLEITENSVISVALLEYYNKVKSSL